MKTWWAQKQQVAPCSITGGVELPKRVREMIGIRRIVYFDIRAMAEAAAE